MIWKWVFKIAIQIIPILLGIDWARPKHGEKLLPPRKRRKFFD
jgi:hypothetical protein